MQSFIKLLIIGALGAVYYANAAIVDRDYYSRIYGDIISDSSADDLPHAIEKRSSGGEHVWECKKKLRNGGYYQGGHDVDELFRHCQGAHERADESGHTYGCHHSNEDCAGCHGDSYHDGDHYGDGPMGYGDGGPHKRRRRGLKKGGF